MGGEKSETSGNRDRERNEVIFYSGLDDREEQEKQLYDIAINTHVFCAETKLSQS